MQARYYDPVVGRFSSTDPVGPAPGNGFNFNRYAYVNNNPISDTDPTGKEGTLDTKGPCAVFACQTFVFGDGGGSVPSASTQSSPSSATGKSASTSGTSAPSSTTSTTLQMASRLSYSDIRDLVSKNNNSGQDDSIVIAVAWGESGFNPNAKSNTSSASGLLQMTRGATKQVGGDFSKIMDPAYNISVGSQYIRLRIQWAQGDLAKGLNGFGTGKANYSPNIISAANALKANPESGVESLKRIHP
jgi:uncharacterized protein RhaS with RHS repeats